MFITYDALLSVSEFCFSRSTNPFLPDRAGGIILCFVANKSVNSLQHKYMIFLTIHVILDKLFKIYIYYIY